MVSKYTVILVVSLAVFIGDSEALRFRKLLKHVLAPMRAPLRQFKMALSKVPMFNRLKKYAYGILRRFGDSEFAELKQDLADTLSNGLSNDEISKILTTLSQIRDMTDEDEALELMMDMMSDDDALSESLHHAISQYQGLIGDTAAKSDHPLSHLIKEVKRHSGMRVPIPGDGGNDE